MNSVLRLQKLFLLIFLIGSLNDITYAIANGSDEIMVKFSSNQLQLKNALDELQGQAGINLIYGAKEIRSELLIRFSQQDLLLNDALAEIENQAPVIFVQDNHQLIVKNRVLEQNYRLKGKVSDSSTGHGLVAASIVIEGSSVGVVTDVDGNFTLNLTPNVYTIVFRYVGYKEQHYQINLFNNLELDVELEMKDFQLGSVDITGNHNLVENLEIGRTIEKLDNKVIEKVSTNNITDALHGRINGVWTTKVSGAPGDHMKIRIRGISSIFGSTDPIFIVDGAMIPIVNFDNLGVADINTNDVESITILKDASSTAIYGNLGGNGVILIETKKGGGKHSFTFQTKQGVQRFDKRYELTSTENFFSTLKASDKINGTRFYYRNPQMHEYEKYPEYHDSLGNPMPGFDFQDFMFNPGKVSEYMFSTKGSAKDFDYYVSGDYFNHYGVVVNSNYNKYTLTANLSKSFKDKATVRFLYRGSRQENYNTLDNYMGNNVILKGINYEPAYLATPDSFLRKRPRIYYEENGTGSANILGNTSMAVGDLFYGTNKVKHDIGNSLNLQGLYKINPTLLFRANVSLAFRKQKYTTNIEPAKTKINPDIPYDPENRYYLNLASTENYIYFTQQYSLNYDKQFNAQKVNATLQYRNYKDNVYWEVDSTSAYDLTFITRDDDIFIRGSQTVYGEKGSVLRAINSFIFNGNYSYRNKYFLSYMNNLEVLHEGEYVSNLNLFNSLALTYDIAAESFLGLPKFISKWHIYMNWGQSGNYPLNSLSNDLFSKTSRYVAEDSLINGVFVSNLANYELNPEHVTETNFGTEINLLKNRINIRADYYKKVNDDLLIKRTIPLYYGGGFVFQNIGQMKNTGLELSLELVPFDNVNTYWSTKFGCSSNNQYITRLDDGVPITFNYTDVLIPDFTAFENEALGAIYGYKYLGLWKDYFDEEYRFKNPYYVENFGLAYERIDTIVSPKIKESDKTIIGNSLPDFTCNWINTFEYKNWSFDMFWYAVFGVDKYNATKASTFMTGLNPMVQQIVLDSMKYHTNKVFYESSYFVEDASFIRLKTISITYKQTRKIANKIALEYTLNLENLVTISDYSGYDPEAAIYTNNNFTDNAIDKGAYPNPMGVYLSIKMTY